MGKEGEAYRTRATKKLDDAKLYVCTFEFHFGASLNRHRVHAIKLRELFTNDLTLIPMISSPSDSGLEQGDDLPMISSQSDSKLKQDSSQSDSVIQQVAVLEGDDVPVNMGVGVFGSRIVLAGGRGVHPTRTYVLETDPSVEANPRFIRSRRKYVIPGLPGGQKIRPWLGEIDGKLYALSGRECDQEGPTFNVFDPETKTWASLPSLPNGDLSWDAIRPSNVAVVGTKIFVTLRTKYETEGRLLFFDVADHPKATWSDREPRIRDDMGVFHAMYNKVLVVDSEEEEDEKLIFSFDDEQIIVSRMVLSPEGETDCIERVAEISLSGALKGVEGTAYSCVHLGGQRVCFAFFWRKNLHVLTFNYSYSKSAASPPLPSSDSEILTCESICGSFSVQTLGLRLFEYNTSQLQDISVLNMGGCFVL